MRKLREQSEQIARILCCILAGLVVYELAGMAIHWNPFRGVTVPELPVLATTTNSSPDASHALHRATATKADSDLNAVHTKQSTNQTSLAGNPAVGTNALATSVTNIEPSHAAAMEKPTATNLAPAMVSTNVGTNLSIASTTGKTNQANSSKHHKSSRVDTAMPGVAGDDSNPFKPARKHASTLSPAAQPRIDIVVNSEILGAMMHPLPMGLLGIAGNVAFLRSDSGQTALVKEGDSLDDLKLLSIGVNRVLIEQNGQKKELMIFSGYGGESLLPKDSTNENIHP